MVYTKYNTDEIKDKLRLCLTQERFEHSMGVMEKAEELAARFGADIKKARCAGILHDCAKCLSKEEMLKYKYCLSECELLSPKTWHAPIGAAIAEKDYGITDSSILSAVRLHTIGSKNMTDFDKIIYLADKIETRTREKEYREKIEAALNKRNSLDDAVLESFKITIESLVKRELPVCFQTIDVYNSLIEKCKN